MNVLVTGGAGYIGSHAVRALLDGGHRVSVVDNLSTGFRDSVDQRAHFFKGDISDSRLIEQIHGQMPIQAVLHFAAFIEVGESVKDPQKYYENNFVKAFQFLKTVSGLKIRQFIFSSTAAVYGSPQTIPIPEEHGCLPINPYGRSKYMFECALRDLSVQNNFKFCIFRYFNVAGAHPSGEIGEAHNPESHLIPNILRSALAENKVFKIFGTDYDTKDGSCVRDYVHVQDLVEAHVLGLEYLKHKDSQVFNLGSAAGYSVKEVFAACEKVLGKKIEFEVSERRAGDPAILIAQNSKARSDLGWKPAYENLETIIEHAWVWHKNHPQGYRLQAAS